MQKQTSWVLTKTDKAPIDIYEEIIKAEKTSYDKYRFFAYLSTICFILSLFINLYAITRPKTVPLVITVSEMGEARYVGDASKFSYAGLKIPLIAIESHLRKYVNNMYVIPADMEILRQNLSDCYSSLTDESAQKLTSFIRKDEPQKQFGKVIRTVKIESFLELTRNSYQIDFLVTTTNKSGGQAKTKRMRGILTTVLLEPPEKERLANPFGMYIKNFDFTELSN